VDYIKTSGMIYSAAGGEMPGH